MATMTDSVQTSMPGSYFLQYDRSHTNSRSSNIFKPPAPSPSQSPRFSQIPRPVSRSSSSNNNHKRPKIDTNTSYFSRPTRPSISHGSSTTRTTPLNLDGSYDNISFSNLDSSTYSLDDQSLASPLPLANSDYRLAGGLDTPSQSFERSLEELAQDEAEKDHRFNRYTTTNTSVTTLSRDDSGRLSVPSIDADVASTGRKRSRSTPPSMRNSMSQSSWGLRNAAWALTGGLAGRVFNFCINTAFRGFKAGGGQPYNVDASTLNVSNSDMYFSSGGISHGVPGAYSSEHDLGGFIEDYMNSPEVRRQRSSYTPMMHGSQWSTTNQDKSAIKNDWQIIDSANFDDSEVDQSPVRKRSRASIAGGWQRSTSSNSTSTGASYASSRIRPPSTGTPTGSYNHQRVASSGNNLFQPARRSRPSVAHVRRSTSHFPTMTSVSSNSYTTRSPERPSSAASMRQPNRVSTPTNNKSTSDLSPEVMSYRRKVRTQERMQDENLRRLNAQLRDMIREGKEALGSTVEIVDDRSGNQHFDEGFYDDGWK